MLRNAQECVGCNTVNGNVEELKCEPKNRNLRPRTRVGIFSRARPTSEENRVGQKRFASGLATTLSFEVTVGLRNSLGIH